MANYLPKNLFFLIQKRFLQSPAALPSIPPLPNSISPISSTLQFLVNSCKIPLKSAQSLSNKFQLDEKTHQNAQSVLQILKSHHFSDSLLAALIVKCPKVLRCNAKSDLKSKLEFLAQNGFQGELLPQIILSNPVIAYKSSIVQIKSCFEYLNSVFDANEKVLVAVKRASWLLTSNLKYAFQPNIDFLLKLGVPTDRVEKLLILQPRIFLLKSDKIVYAVNSIRGLGFEPTDPMFIHALRVMSQLSESTWKKKIEIMKSMGFDESEVFEAFRRCPSFLGNSEEKLRKRMDFYVNTVNLEPSSLIANPVLFKVSIENTVRPRYNVLVILKEKGLIRGMKNKFLFSMGEKSFRERYIDRFINEVPGLLEAYVGSKEVMKIGS